MYPSRHVLRDISIPTALNLFIIFRLSIAEIQLILDESASESDFEDSGSEFLPSEDSSKEDLEATNGNVNVVSDNDTASAEESGEYDNAVGNVQATSNNVVDGDWVPVPPQFQPIRAIPSPRTPEILGDLKKGCTELDCFLKVFPKSLLMFIAQCTNMRLKKVADQCKRKKVSDPLYKANSRAKQANNETDMYEILAVLGVITIMGYNKLPSFQNYWSQEESLGNTVIKKALSRERCTLLLSKMYYNIPEKPVGASKIYYLEEVVNCFKKTFPSMRSESPYQAVDESMAKFKGRSSLKQYMPLKPIKRGIKFWERCDSDTGYIYDLNIYQGKESGAVDGTACVGTYMANRKDTPKFEEEQLERGEARFLKNSRSIVATKWRDTKDVYVLSNCHSDNMTKTKRKLKTGESKEFDCPDMIQFYNTHMGGVDLSDQQVILYDFDRKSQKWWRKGFYKLLNSAMVNSWIIFNDISGTRKKSHKSLLQFLVPLAEQIIRAGMANTKVKKRVFKDGRLSKRAKLMVNVGDHMPSFAKQRRRCKMCTENERERRTTQYCLACNIPL